MKIHEYQAKELMGAYGIPIPGGTVAETAEEAREIAKTLGRSVIKAQIHSGGRGKGGGVKVAETPDEAYEITKKSLSRLYADLTNDGLTKELREQKDNRVLNTENMKLMMGTIRDDPADRKLLLVFSNVIQEVWMGDEEVYAAWRQSECPFGLFSYGAMSIPQDLFQNSNRVLH